jgi:hypothetical protein
MKPRYHLTAHIGVYWKGPDIDLGSFRWEWMAQLYARAYLWAYPYRAVTVSLS